MEKLTNEEIREKVRQRYASAITAKTGCGCGGGCCGSGAGKATETITGNLYSADEVAGRHHGFGQRQSLLGKADAFAHPGEIADQHRLAAHGFSSIRWTTPLRK